jgi:hypothetical protein
MGMISGILSLVGGIVSAAGAMEAGNYAAQVAENNAKIAEQNAQYAREAGMQAATDESRAGAVKSAEIGVALAANNVDVNTGSASDVRAGQRELNVYNTATVEQNKGILPAYGYTVQASNYRAQAAQDRIGAGYSAAGDIIGGIGSFAGDASGSGMFGGGIGSSPAFAASAAAPVDTTLSVAGGGATIPSYGSFPGTGWPA